MNYIFSKDGDRKNSHLSPHSLSVSDISDTQNHIQTYIGVDGFEYNHHNIKSVKIDTNEYIRIKDSDKKVTNIKPTNMRMIDSSNNLLTIESYIGVDGFLYDQNNIQSVKIDTNEYIKIKDTDKKVTNIKPTYSVKIDTTDPLHNLKATCGVDGFEYDEHGIISSYYTKLYNRGFNSIYDIHTNYKKDDMILYNGELIRARYDFNAKTFNMNDWALVGDSWLTMNYRHQTFSIEGRRGISIFRDRIHFNSGESAKTVTFLKAYSTPPIFRTADNTSNNSYSTISTITRNTNSLGLYRNYTYTSGGTTYYRRPDEWVDVLVIGFI